MLFLAKYMKILVAFPSMSAPPQRPPRLLFHAAEPTPVGHLSSAGYVASAERDSFRTMRVFGNYALVYLITGEGTYSDARGLTQEVTAGDAIIVFPEIAHRYGPGRGQTWNEIYAVFKGPLFDLWRERGILDDRRPVIHADPQRDWLGLLEEVLGAEPPHATTPMHQLLQFTDVFTALVQSATSGGKDHKEDHWLRYAKELLNANLEHEVTAATVARQVGLSHENFRKRFAKETGMAPAHYRTQQRIAAARELLLRPNFTLRAIADSLGFSDEFHFSRRFKEITGQTPREFRKAAFVQQNSDT